MRDSAAAPNRGGPESSLDAFGLGTASDHRVSESEDNSMITWQLNIRTSEKHREKEE
jgi:hypothetical protein